MKDTLLSSFNGCAKRLCRIVMDFAPGVFLFAGIHRLMGGVLNSDVFIGMKLIRHQVSTLAHKLVNHWGQFGNAVAADMGGPHRFQIPASSSSDCWFPGCNHRWIWVVVFLQIASYK